MPSVSGKSTARALGLRDEFETLQGLRRGFGNPQPEDLLRLPSVFLIEVLHDEAGTDRALRTLIDLVDSAPAPEAELLRMSFNFDHEFGELNWTDRVIAYATKVRKNEKTIRDAADLALVELIRRASMPAAEKLPEIAEATSAQPPNGPVAMFFDQNYVRNSPLFLDAWSTAATVDVCGFGHNRMLVACSIEVGSLLARGGAIRVLLQNPEGHAVIESNFRSSTPKASEEDVRHQHRAGIAVISSLLKSKGAAGTLLVRTYDIVPPFTAYFFDAEDENGLAFIWFWSWRQASSWRPGFSIRKSEDALWFGRFYAQFEAMWNDGDMSAQLVVE